MLAQDEQKDVRLARKANTPFETDKPLQTVWVGSKTEEPIVTQKRSLAKSFLLRKNQKRLYRKGNQKKEQRSNYFMC